MACILSPVDIANFVTYVQTRGRAPSQYNDSINSSRCRRNLQTIFVVFYDDSICFVRFAVAHWHLGVLEESCRPDCSRHHSTACLCSLMCVLLRVFTFEEEGNFPTHRKQLWGHYGNSAIYPHVHISSSIDTYDHLSLTVFELLNCLRNVSDACSPVAVLGMG